MMPKAQNHMRYNSHHDANINIWMEISFTSLSAAQKAEISIMLRL